MISSIVKSCSNGYAEPSFLLMRRRKLSLLGGGEGKVSLVITPSANHSAPVFQNQAFSRLFQSRGSDVLESVDVPCYAQERTGTAHYISYPGFGYLEFVKLRLSPSLLTFKKQNKN